MTQQCESAWRAEPVTNSQMSQENCLRAVLGSKAYKVSGTLGCISSFQRCRVSTAVQWLPNRPLSSRTAAGCAAFASSNRIGSHQPITSGVNPGSADSAFTLRALRKSVATESMMNAVSAASVQCGALALNRDERSTTRGLTLGTQYLTTCSTYMYYM